MTRPNGNGLDADLLSVLGLADLGPDSPQYVIAATVDAVRVWQATADPADVRAAEPRIREAWARAGQDADALWRATVDARPTSRPAIVRLADVEPEDVTWLWEPYIARRKLTLLEGDPAAGKTWVALSIAAILSRAGHWPLGGRAEIGRTLYLTAEDGIADTIRPRLDALGADPAQVYALTGTIRIDPDTGEEVEHGGVTIADVATIEAALEQVRPALVVIDPIQGFLGAKVDMHRANEVRPLLAQLARWAERYDCAVLILRHLAKSRASKAAYQGLGSIDFTAAARSVLLAGQDPESGERSVVHLKSSLASAGPSIGYELRQGQGLVWTGASEATAASLLAPETVDGDSRRSALEEATDWLKLRLGDGPQPAKWVQTAARQDGLAWATVRRAKDVLGIESRKVGESWTWVLNTRNEHVEHLEHLEKAKENSSEIQGAQGAQGAHSESATPPHTQIDGLDSADWTLPFSEALPSPPPDTVPPERIGGEL